MTHKIFVTTILTMSSIVVTFAYGRLGHRTIADVAQKHLSGRAKRVVNHLLETENLVLVSNYADEIKSEKSFSYSFSWHYLNMGNNETLKEVAKNPAGDLITAYKDCVATLRDKSSPYSKKVFALKMLVHIIGDAHQPLHIGHREDKGGNMILVEWFSQKTNLHKVWDEDMLQTYGMSYSELSENLPKLSPKVRKEWEMGTFEDWVEEVHEITPLVYLSAQTGDKLSYRYMYDYFDIVPVLLHKAGIRLAKVLNETLQN